MYMHDEIGYNTICNIHSYPIFIGLYWFALQLQYVFGLTVKMQKRNIIMLNTNAKNNVHFYSKELIAITYACKMREYVKL